MFHDWQTWQGWDIGSRTRRCRAVHCLPRASPDLTFPQTEKITLPQCFYKSSFVPPLTHCTIKNVSTATQWIPYFLSFPFEQLVNDAESRPCLFSWFSANPPTQNELCVESSDAVIEYAHGYSRFSAECCIQIWAVPNGDHNTETFWNKNADSSTWDLLTRQMKKRSFFSNSYKTAFFKLFFLARFMHMHQLHMQVFWEAMKTSRFVSLWSCVLFDS